MRMNIGRIVVIFGGMFSGKTKEVERRVERVQIMARRLPELRIGIFKPARDTRVERCGNFDAVKVPRPAGVLPLAKGLTHVFIDEAHFWNTPEEVEELRQLAIVLARGGVEVMVSLLNADFRGLPFLTSGAMLAIASEVVLFNAVCGICGRDASFSQRITEGTATLQVGSSEYEPRCVACYVPPTT